MSYRGGDPCFVPAGIDERTIAFPNYNGNGMHVSSSTIRCSPSSTRAQSIVSRAPSARSATALGDAYPWTHRPLGVRAQRGLRVAGAGLDDGGVGGRRAARGRSGARPGPAGCLIGVAEPVALGASGRNS